MYFYAIWYWRISSFNFKGTVSESYKICETLVNISDEKIQESFYYLIT